jgi:S-adenosylmethionine synthetase
MSKTTLFTSESVTEGHPDKICDQISDAIVDAILAEDPEARVAAETVATTGVVLVTGEISTKTYVDIPALVRRVVSDIGYSGHQAGGFDASTCAVFTAIDEQSPEIATGVSVALEHRNSLSDPAFDAIGAGDQGIIFGYASNETSDYLPLAIVAANRIAKRLAYVRKAGILPYLRPDGKTQVTIEYKDNQPVRVHSIVISAQHDPQIAEISDNVGLQERIARDLRVQVIEPVFTELAVKPDDDTKFYINPSGRFVSGGPQSDSGLTGRKIIVDTYGGYARHGGGAFSGKDPTKVDRSAAYAARHAAKNIVAAGIAERCEIQIAYAIGVARPISINVTTFGTGKLSDEEITELVEKTFDLRPAAIIDRFQLRYLPKLRGGRFYRDVAAYGHFGRPDLELPWEELNYANQLKEALLKSSSRS